MRQRRFAHAQLSSRVPLGQLFAGLDGAALAHEAEADAAAAPAPAVSMRRGGGASSSASSTWMADGTEWSATGRLGVSLAALSGLQDAAFARARAVSRLREMGAADAWPPRERRI